MDEGRARLDPKDRSHPHQGLDFRPDSDTLWVILYQIRIDAYLSSAPNRLAQGLRRRIDAKFLPPTT